MKIAISGASGYIAKNLILKLEVSSKQVIPIGRNDLYDPDSLEQLLAGVDVIIHLAGAPILQKWTSENKHEILRSRTETTRTIVKAVNSLPLEKRPKTFISASAIGIYQSGFEHTENSTRYANDFAGEVSQMWEESSAELSRSVRKIIFRIGVVLGKESKTIQNLILPFKLGLGGKIGSGSQSFPFIHIEDVTSAIYWAIYNAEVHGIYNLVAPQNITNAQFTKVLATVLRRPAIVTVPSKAIQLIYGEASSVLLNGPAVIPERLQNYGFRFKYPDIESSLKEIVGRN